MACFPKMFKNSIPKAEAQNILNRSFSEVMVDTVNLLFLKIFQQNFIQILCRFDVRTKRLLNQNPSVAAFRQSAFTKLLENHRVIRRWHCKVEHFVQTATVLFIKQINISPQ